MPISFTINNDNVDMLLDDLRRIFPQLVNRGLPPMQEQPKENREPLPAENVKEIEQPKRTRKTKEKEPVTEEVKTEDKGESSGAVTADDAGSASSQAEIPDIEDLRARLKTLGATEGFGHDKVFEVLGKYGAKNASTVPEEKRADCIAEIDELLKAGK